jgi:sterol desaturase/sphingolipid hydroxylase (fatty acid hydroxylase superfamily)
MTSILIFAAWVTGSCISAELLGYWLHRLLHSGAIGFLSRSHMKHHLVIYAPTEDQRSTEYHDATADSLSLGNIGAEWLAPAAVLLAVMLAILNLFQVRLAYQVTYVVTTLAWSFLMFSYLHDAMHIQGFWLTKNRYFRRWFLSARQCHDAHHFLISDRGLMNRNFGIGFFIFDRVFGTFSEGGTAFNQDGYQAAQKRFEAVLGDPA